MPNEWLEETEQRDEYFGCPSSKRPSIAVGDLVAYYAVGWQRVCAACRVTRGPEWEPGRAPSDWDGRWNWIVEVEMLLAVPFLERCPSLERCGVGSLSVRSQSHIRLTPQQYRSCVAGLAETAALNGELYAALAA